LAAADRAAIEALRAEVASAKAAEPARPTVEQVSRIVADVRSLTSLGDTATALGLDPGVDAQAFVLDVVATFGTWLAHSVGSTDATVKYLASCPQGFLLDPVENGLPVVVAPLGYEPSAPHKRDLGKALCAVAAVSADSDLISRFVARTYASRPSTLSFMLVAGTWSHVTRNRASTVRLVSEDLVFRGLAVEAFDLLDVAREDGVRAIEYLLGCDGTQYAAISAAARRAEWLAEAPLRAIARACELAPTSETAAARLVRDLAHLQAAVQARPLEFTPPGVRNLTLGHVQRICAAAGLKIRVENRLEEVEIRATLKELGLSVDTDRLVPEALRLADKGLLDEFWEVMTARLEQDPTWVEQLAELTGRQA
jgi:hypothetical protein